MSVFGDFVRKLRIENSYTLREFCRIADVDPSNWSKIERGINPPTKNKLILQNIAKSLNLNEGTDDYDTLFELAAIEYFPKELLSDQNVVDRLPIFFRTIRGEKPNREELQELIKLLRKV